MVDMTKTAAITIWSGCDSKVEDAINAVIQAWEPYSAKSRRFSIFRLLREQIDPVWFDFCKRTPALGCEKLNQAWARYQNGRAFRCQQSCQELPLEGTSSPSLLAQHLGFNELDWFLKAVARNAAERDSDLIPTLDSLRDLAIACRAKQPRRLGKVRLLPGKEKCRYCDQLTELAVALANDDDSGLSRSSLYCSTHKPKKVLSDAVGRKYQKARRSQGAFDRELERLDFQSWAGLKAAHAKSGNPLVDEFIWRLSVHRRLTHEQHSEKLGALETKLRWEARMLVDRRITDRKKEIIA
ncbi:MAG: hypothetical protein WJ306_01470 [Ferrovum myxofaciens]